MLIFGLSAQLVRHSSAAVAGRRRLSALLELTRHYGDSAGAIAVLPSSYAEASLVQTFMFTVIGGCSAILEPPAGPLPQATLQKHWSTATSQFRAA